jgi:PAS domain S-box-containing protein
VAGPRSEGLEDAEGEPVAAVQPTRPAFRGALPAPASVLDLMGDTVFIIDAHGHLLYASASCLALCGHPREALLDRGMLELVHPADREHTLSMVWRVMHAQAPVRYRNRWIHRDGSLVAIEWVSRWDSGSGVRVAVARRVEAAEDEGLPVAPIAEHRPERMERSSLVGFKPRQLRLR